MNAASSKCEGRSQSRHFLEIGVPAGRLFPVLLSIVLLAWTGQLLRAHTCPLGGSRVGIAIAITATYPNRQPVGPGGPAPGDDLLIQMALVYTYSGPDETINAAVQNGRMLLQIGGTTTDVTPPGGVPLVGGDGTPGCDGTPVFKSLLLPYTVTIADRKAGGILITGIYTNGIAHTGEDDQVVLGSESIEIPVGAAAGCGIACFVSPATNQICAGQSATFTVFPTNGAPPYQFSWTGPNGFAATTASITLSNAQLTDAGAYLVSVTDSNGCTAMCDVTVRVNPPIAGPEVVCPQAVNTYSVVRDGTDDRDYEWELVNNNSGASIVENSGSSVQVYSGTNGSYLLRLRVVAGETTLETCEHLSTILDTAAPAINCGSALVVSENPRASGSARVNFPLPSASDDCDTNPFVTCVPPPGSSFPVGDTTVVCKALDDLGNSAECSFTVKVVPFVIFVVTSANDSGPGTLRQALLDANATPGLNLIRFQLPGPAPQTLRPLSALPTISEPVRLEGLPLGASNVPPGVVLDGSLVQAPSFVPPGTEAIDGGTDGLVLLAPSNVVRGLVISNFRTGIRVEGQGGNQIEANWIGTDASGEAPSANLGSGIVVRSPDNILSNNVISGNAHDGIQLDSASARNNSIAANRIGLAANGVVPLPNGRAGVRVLNGANGNAIGGSRSALANTIGFNGEAGIALEISAGTGNRISGNSIGANIGLGIDSGNDGPTENDALDADAGPNNYQNFPVLTDARSDITESTIVTGLFSGSPSRSLTLEFFLQPAGASAGFEQGQSFLGSTVISTDETGAAAFEAEFRLPATRGQSVVATATDEDGSTSEFSPAVEVQTPPETVLGPASTTVPSGGSVTLCVEVTGIGPFIYQWRKDGRNISGETNQCISITNFQLQSAGAYTVAVANDAGAVLSSRAVLLLEAVPRVNASDLFVDRAAFVGPSGSLSSSNVGATGEPGEPAHYSRPASSSIWYTWTPSRTGIATIRTAGSTFDTILAVYAGETLETLIEVGSDDDRGGFLSSEVRFNALEGTNYQIVVDGFAGAVGDLLLSWEFEPTPTLLPVIIAHPQSLTVAPGAPAVFMVDAIPGCFDGHHDCRHFHEHHPNHSNDVIILDYQWFLNGQTIAGATNTNYVVESVSEELVGQYTVQVSKFGRVVESRPASLQINLTGQEVQPAFAADKFSAAAESPIFLGGLNAPPPSVRGLPPGTAAFAAATVVRGYTGTQVFNTANGGTEPNDLPICGVIGGASVWVTFVPLESGVLYLNTDGSSYNTVMGVFIRSPLNPAILQLLECDNNSGLDGRDSALNLPVTAGVTNFVMIDGVNGATGTLKLNYSLVTASTLISLGQSSEGHVQVRVSGRPAMRFLLEASTDFITWSPVITTNSATGIFDFIDTQSQSQPRRAYRARMLP